jgi:glutathione S-transferase
VKIYNSSVAPNPRRVRIFLAEKGIQVPYQEVDLAKSENRQAEFRKINPLATVPVLELEDGTHIAESIAICRYFEQVQPEPPLFGIGGKRVRDRRNVATADGVHSVGADCRCVSLTA